jgi:hypothetical protein
MTDRVRLDRERDDECYRTLERLRWGDEVRCVTCDSANVTFLEPRDERGRLSNRGHWSRRRIWKCNACYRQFSVTVGTVMHGSHLPLTLWLDVATRVERDGETLTASMVVRDYGIAFKTAALLLERVSTDLRSRDSLLGPYALGVAA